MKTIMVTLCIILFLICSVSQATISIEPHKEIPCVYQGHLKTKQSWFGFLANISVISSARMTFELIYPANFCCQKIVFYSDDKINLVNHKLSCYQKFHLSKPEDDQILRLTPKFPWSGCHLIHQSGQSFYICEGGRSFIVEKENTKAGSWYLAVMNCDTIYGLNLQYRFSVYGQVGVCRADLFSKGLNPLSPQTFPVAKAQMRNNEVEDDYLSTTTCTYSGELNTTSNWHGFIANTSIARGGGFQFEFSYPIQMKTQRIILYGPTEVDSLKEGTTCWQKNSAISRKDANERIIELAIHASWNGCVLKNPTTTDAMVVCKGQRHFNDQQKFFIAVSKCDDTIGIYLKYHIHVFAFNGKYCSHSLPIAPTTFSYTWICYILGVIVLNYI